MAELEGDDDFPIDFDGLDFDNIPELRAPAISRDSPQIFLPSPAAPRNLTPPIAPSPVSSSGSNSVEDMDPAFLAAADVLEARALNQPPRGTESTQDIFKRQTFETPFESLQSVDEHSVQCIEALAMKRKGKRKAEEDVDVRGLLAGYETELNCPICYDLLVGAQVANPCGHTCCGECSYGWLAQNKYESTCAVCRSNLCSRNPLLPNFAVDAFVRQHLQALARSGRPEWQETGYRTIEWNKRLESWKTQKAIKGKAKETTRQRRRQPPYYDNEVVGRPYVFPWIIDEGMDDQPLVIMPRRGTRSRR